MNKATGRRCRLERDEVDGKSVVSQVEDQTVVL